MKKLLALILAGLSCTCLYSQTNENKPVKPENVSYFLADKKITDSLCDCNKGDHQSVIVKVKVTAEMFQYDLIQIGARYFGDNEKTTNSGGNDAVIKFDKSDFKNKFSVGSEITLELKYSSFCLTSTYMHSEWKKYIIEVVGANITSYNEYYDNGYQQYVKYPVYGEYDYLVRSTPFKFLVNTDEVDKQRQKENSERQKENFKEKRNNIIYTIIGIAAGAYLLSVLIKDYRPQ